MSERVEKYLDAGAQLWSFVPGWTRAKDRRAAGMLEGLARALGVGVGAVRADIYRLLDDMFIETCSEDLVPLIADLVGVSVDPAIPVSRQRYQVKYALHWRRRKGTSAQLEALVWIISGFRARVIELSRPTLDVGDAPRTAVVSGRPRASVLALMPRVSGEPASAPIRVVVDVVWPVRRRDVLLTPLQYGGSIVHGLPGGVTLGLRRADGGPIFRSDDAHAFVGNGLDIELVTVAGDHEHIGRLTPQFRELGGSAPPYVPQHTIAIDPERARVAGPSAPVSELAALRRYRLRFWEPTRAEFVRATPRYIGDGIYSFSPDGASSWLTDAYGNRLVVLDDSVCGRSNWIADGERGIWIAAFHGEQGFGDSSRYVLLEPGPLQADAEAELARGLPLDIAGLARLFAIEDRWGWDGFRRVRIVRRFSSEVPPDGTVEVDLRRGQFRVGAGHTGSELSVRFYRRYQVEKLQQRVREELLHAAPIGRRVRVEFRDTAVAGSTARSTL